MKLTITIDISVSHPEEIWENCFQLRGLGGPKGIECNKKFVENGAERVFSDLFLFFKKALYELSVSGLQFSFIIFQ